MMLLLRVCLCCSYMCCVPYALDGWVYAQGLWLFLGFRVFWLWFACAVCVVGLRLRYLPRFRVDVLLEPLCLGVMYVLFCGFGWMC